jgi:ABC-2 type transport system permease protein
LPFASLLQAPVDLLLGKADGGAAGLTLAGQLGWGLVLLLIGRRVLVVAERRLVIQGG